MQIVRRTEIKGDRYQSDEAGFDASGHLALGQSLFFEPVMQYLLNGNSQWNPFVAKGSKGGFHIGATLTVSLS